MHRLAVLEHDKIGDVHDIVNRALSRCLQTVLHPLGRGFNDNIFTVRAI